MKRLAQTVRATLAPAGALILLTACGAAPANVDQQEKSRAEQAAMSQPEPDIIFTGTCDGSAAALFGKGQIVVANDEDSKLRVYNLADGSYVKDLDFDLTKDLSLTGKEPDIEAAATADGRIYWTTSHGRKKVDKDKPEKSRLRDPDRFRFFATPRDHKLATVGAVGDELLTKPRLAALGLDAAEPLAPEEGGINIEGMAAGAHSSMLLGFRSPLRAQDGKSARAIVIPLTNAKALIDGAGDAQGGRPAPQFGNPIYLDLGGNGIRDMIAYRDGYLLIAGSIADGGTFSLYRWDGRSTKAELIKANLSGMTAEALIDLGDNKMLVLSDEGDTKLAKYDGLECKDKKVDPSKRSFFGRVIRLPG